MTRWCEPSWRCATSRTTCASPPGGLGVVRAADPAVGVPVRHPARAAAVRRRGRARLAGGASAAPAGDDEPVPGGGVGAPARPTHPGSVDRPPTVRRGATTWCRCSSICGTRRWRRRRCSWGCGCPSGAPSHRLIAAVWRHPGYIEHARLLSHVERVTETVGAPGDGGAAGHGRGDGVAAAPLHRARAAGAGLAVAGRVGRVGRRRPAQLHRRGRLCGRAVGPDGAR